MTSGAEHYAAAERSVEATVEIELEPWYDSRTDRDEKTRSFMEAMLGYAEAQVHATLALAAAMEKQTQLAHGVDSGGYGR